MSDEAVHFESVLFRAVLDAMFHDIASNLLLGKHQELVDAEANDLGPCFQASLTDDGLDDVVAPVVGDQSGRMFVEFLEEESFVFFGALLDHSLDHTASILLLRELKHLATDGVIDKVNTVARQLGQNLLDDVVSVIAAHDAKDLGLKLLGQLDLLFH